MPFYFCTTYITSTKQSTYKERGSLFPYFKTLFKTVFSCRSLEKLTFLLCLKRNKHFDEILVRHRIEWLWLQETLAWLPESPVTTKEKMSIAWAMLWNVPTPLHQGQEWKEGNPIQNALNIHHMEAEQSRTWLYIQYDERLSSLHTKKTAYKHTTI